MNNKENKSSSNLIKSIYKSYIDLKTGDLHDLDYDILLENIKSLYLDVKAMRVHPFDVLDETNPNTLKPNDNINNPKNTILNLEKIEQVDDKTDKNLSQDVSNEEINKPINLEEKKDEIITPDDKVENTDSNQIGVINEPIEVQEIEEVDSVDEFNNTMSSTSNLEQESDIDDNKKLEDTGDTEENEKENKDDINIDENNLNEIDNNLHITEKNITENLSEDSINSDLSSNHASTNELDEEPLEFDLNEKSIKEKSSSNIVSFLKEETTPSFKPVGDLIDMIDINTRIGLVEIFFKGDSLSLSESLSILNKTDDRNKSIQIIDKLAEKYNVNQEDDIYGTFINLIDRKFGIS